MSSKQSLIPVMNGQYEQIAAIESQWGIRLKEGDMRPRIEYFHDAVRALVSGEASLYEKNSRLSVEYLAYDLSQLRMIQGNPAGTLHRGTQGSTRTDLAPAGQPASRRSSPDSATRRELAQLYKDYTVLFAALFAEIVDMNFQSRADQVDQAVQDITNIDSILKQLRSGKMRRDQALALLEEVEQDHLRQRVQQALGGQALSAGQYDQLAGQLQQFEQQLESEKQKADKAHTAYRTSQLAVYEESRETVKRLAGQGMNLAGKFVESAISQAAGRGREM